MGKKLTVGKLFGIIFCIVGTLLACVLLGYNFYLSGQMKLVDKYLKAVAREDFTSYTQCFESEVSAKLSEVDMEAERKIMAEHLAEAEEFKMTADFRGREKLDNGKYRVIFDLTIYNDNEHVKLDDYYMELVREKGKWVLEAEE